MARPSGVLRSTRPSGRTTYRLVVPRSVEAVTGTGSGSARAGLPEIGATTATASKAARIGSKRKRRRPRIVTILTFRSGRGKGAESPPPHVIHVELPAGKESG